MLELKSPAGHTPETLDKVGTEVRRQLRGRLRRFELTQCGDGVVLSGVANSFYAKQLAQHAVMRATVLPIVRNEIEVLCALAKEIER